MEDRKEKREIKSAASKPKIEPLFSKEQLLTAKRFQDKRDMLNALLSPEKQYAVETVEQMVKTYQKGQVK